MRYVIQRRPDTQVKALINPTSFHEKLKTAKNFSRLNRHRLAAIRQKLRKERKLRDEKKHEMEEDKKRWHTKYDYVKSRFRVTTKSRTMKGGGLADPEQRKPYNKLTLPNIKGTTKKKPSSIRYERKTKTTYLPKVPQYAYEGSETSSSYLRRRKQEWGEAIRYSSRPGESEEPSAMSSEEIGQVVTRLTRDIERTKRLLLTVPMSTRSRAAQRKRHVLDSKVKHLEGLLKHVLVSFRARGR